jgi:hypothetical protein
MMSDFNIGSAGFRHTRPSCPSVFRRLAGRTAVKKS